MLRIGRSVFAVTAMVLFICTLVVVMMLSYLSFQGERRSILQGVRLFAHETTVLVGRELGGAVQFGKTDKIEEAVFNLIADAEGQALGGLVINSSEEVVFKSSKVEATNDQLLDLARIALATGHEQMSTDRLFVAVPLVFGKDNQTVGVLTMGFSPDVMFARARDEMTQNLLLGFGVFLVCLLCSILFLRRYLSRPLKLLQSALNDIAASKLDIVVPYTRRKDEIGAISVAIDALRTELQRAEAVQFESFFRSGAFNASSAAMMITDKDFNIKVINGAAQSLMEAHVETFKRITADFDPQSLAGSSMDVFHSDPEQKRLMLADKQTYPFVANIEVGNAIFDLSINAVTDEEGNVIGRVVEWADVTEVSLQSAIMNALNREQVKAEFGMSGTLVGHNSQWEKIFGPDMDAANPVCLMNVLKMDPKYSDMGMTEVLDRMGKGETVTGKFVLTTPDGRESITEGSLNAVKDKRGKAIRIVLIAKDITILETGLRKAEGEREHILNSQAAVVEELTTALASLQSGNLSVQLSRPFDTQYENLRNNFNSALRKMSQAIENVKVVAGSIRQEASEITNSADNLARRTERSAATLEETAASLNLLTGSVKAAALGAQNANSLVDQAKLSAEQSGQVVKDAVQAMSAIEMSSSQISKIITVIDDIAFQTNLLALNAGVEAARAGDAGRGFAVVASEVRALAQRSSDAAKEINSLISKSGTHVQLGVKLVDQAGTALDAIAIAVKELSQHVAEIAESSTQQSSSISEINAAVSQLDQATQQNAAMFEETTAASHALTNEAVVLMDAVGIFQTDALDDDSGEAGLRQAS